jgi:putative transposase
VVRIRTSSVLQKNIEKLPLNVREWDFPEWVSHHNRNINASINILTAKGEN